MIDAPSALDPARAFGDRTGMILRTRAPAKINLTLHVVRRRLDGFHDLESLVAFAGVADVLELDGDAPLGLDVCGPMAVASGAVADNLVLRAAATLSELVPGLRTGRFRLVKRLPVGAGIGGGSSDAAAALRLLGQLNGLPVADPRLYEAARRTGSDVPVCLVPRTRMMRGTGDRLDRHRRGRPIYAVLVNPGVHLETRSVFGGMGLAKGQEIGLGRHADVPDGLAGDALFDLLAAARNDMQAAASALAPTVPQVLDALAAVPDARLARMSGSGSTCFALFDERKAARDAAGLLKRAEPDWWVKPTALM